MLYHVQGLTKKRNQEDGDYLIAIPKLRFERGDKILVTGPSGCGKSTLLDMLGLILRPDEATSWQFAPEEGYSWEPATLWKKNRLEDLAGIRTRIGYISQTGALLPFLTVRDNIALPACIQGGNPETHMASLCESLGIIPLLNKYPAQLSVGERQRVAIARALATRPPLILADEPTAALDLTKAKTVMDLFMRVVEEAGAALVLVTHSPELAVGRSFRKFSFIPDNADSQLRRVSLLPVNQGGLA